MTTTTTKKTAKVKNIQTKTLNDTVQVRLRTSYKPEHTVVESVQVIIVLGLWENN
jgi:GTPase